ncbi:hypothetical protein [Allochromatium vinosum]|uniref:Uncharacterized protein n=1 Tax=Allochromatium vinosum (strain ATCC 17899 / DSM 180 / NBRC 103801 / NCIMB 10441 / D) TaxID=572477 RepID=D3RUV7_ALLVD|nr:hypothetical protein [Allochromatium vinosum]ADC61006.1 hypothetical protein Alvin_0034 [Allochromatium vinosum DSM 180]MBK1655065.1 hypothetical protein [Allochromatium vinosum]
MSDSNSRDLTQQDIDDSRRDGLSLATALVILAEDAWDGVRMEYDHVIAQHGQMHEGWTLASQHVFLDGERRYDRLDIVLSSGEKLSYFFDITNFYGRHTIPDDDDSEAGILD